MTSFISGTLLKEEPCCKFMLKYEFKNYFRQIYENFKHLFPVKHNTHGLAGV